MGIHIALLRSIVIVGCRVGGAEARALAEAVGGRDVRSVIATGNVLFRSRKRPETLERELEAACERAYGRATEIVVKRADAWRALADTNPFPDEASAAPARVLAWAMRDPLPDEALAQLRRRARPGERVERTAAGDFYCWFGDAPISQSGLAGGFGLRALGAVGTNRNWNTVRKISAALDAMERA